MKTKFERNNYCNKHKKDNKMPESPCKNCQVGWGSYTAIKCSQPYCDGIDVEIKTCKEDCIEYQQWLMMQAF